MQVRSRQELRDFEGNARDWFPRVEKLDPGQWPTDRERRSSDLEDWHVDEVWTAINGYLAQMYLPGEG